MAGPTFTGNDIGRNFGYFYFRNKLRPTFVVALLQQQPLVTTRAERG